MKLDVSDVRDAGVSRTRYN